MVRVTYLNGQDGRDHARENQQHLEKLQMKIMSQNHQLFDNFHPLGYAFFTNQIQKKQNFTLLNKTLAKRFYTEYWYFQVKSQKFQQNLQVIFNMMLESQAQFLSFQGLPMPKILKTISHVKFYELTSLNLYKCEILSIEALSFIDAPNLKTLNLIYNHVYEYKSLNKVNFKLEKLYIYERSQEDVKNKQIQSPFVRLDESTRWNFNLINLRLEKHFYNKPIMEDLSFLYKLRRNKDEIEFNLNFFNIDINISMNTRRILQRKLYQKYFDESKIRLFLFEMQDSRQFPVRAYIFRHNFNAFHIQRGN